MAALHVEAQAKGRTGKGTDPIMHHQTPARECLHHIRCVLCSLHAVRCVSGRHYDFLVPFQPRGMRSIGSTEILVSADTTLARYLQDRPYVIDQPDLKVLLTKIEYF